METRGSNQQLRHGQEARFERRPRTSEPEAAALSAADEFVAYALGFDRDHRRAGRTVPEAPERREFVDSFWTFVERLETAVGGRPASALPELRRAVVERVGPVLFRSRPIARSYWKPHGYTGDFRTMELIYDLEERAGLDPTQPALVNGLDFFYSTLHSVRGVWERRWAFRDLLSRRLEESAGRAEGEGGGLAVLDVACGGARYIRDVVASELDTSRLELLAIDQDAAAIEALRRGLASLGPRLQAVSIPITALPGAVGERTFDVALSSGLFDYLDDDSARRLLALMASRLRPGGTLAITNFHPDDPSAFCKDWLGDWQLVFRREAEVRDLFPSDLEVTTRRSGDGSLVLAFGRRASAVGGER